MPHGICCWLQLEGKASAGAAATAASASATATAAFTAYAALQNVPCASGCRQDNSCPVDQLHVDPQNDDQTLYDTGL
jgi:hypothetical protein